MPRWQRWESIAQQWDAWCNAWCEYTVGTSARVGILCMHLVLLVQIVRPAPLRLVGGAPRACARRAGGHARRVASPLLRWQLGEAERRLHLQRPMRHRLKPVMISGVSPVRGVVADQLSATSSERDGDGRVVHDQRRRCRH